MNFKQAAIGAAFCMVLMACTSTSLSGQDTWIGGSGTVWNTAANWDTGAVPNLTTSEAIVGAPAPTDATSNLNIASLSVESDGILNVGPSTNFDFSGMQSSTLTNMGVINVLNNTDFQLQDAVNNSGEITVESLGSFADLEVDAVGAQVSGGGMITLLGGVNARLMGLNSLLNVDDQTIQGRGQIGGNTIAMELSPLSVVNANVNGELLTLDTNATHGTSGFGTVNRGTMRASNGGILRLQSDEIDNNSGVIEALDGSTVNLFGTLAIQGGTVRSFDSGVVQVDTSVNVFFEDLTTDGDVRVANNSDLGLTGTINNLDAITVNSAGSFSDVEIQSSGATMTGGGTVTLDGSTNARVVGINAFLNLDHQTIQGMGQVGVNTLAMEIGANSLIDANSNGNTLTFDTNFNLGSTSFGTENNGTMRASNGGSLIIQNDAIDNSNGVIEALDGSTVNLSGTLNVVGGLLRSVDSGLIMVNDSVDVFLEDLTINADFQTGNNIDLGLTGTINNQNSIMVNSTGSLSDIEIQESGATLTGGGTVNLAGSVNARVNGINALLLVGDQTIEGIGQIGVNTLAMELSPNAMIDANSSGNTLALNTNADFGTSGFGTVNNGTLRASSGGTLVIQNNSIDNTNGVIEALANSTVNLTEGATIVGGLVRSLGDGQVTTATSVNVFLENLTVNADLQTSNNIDLGVTGTINNLGTISINSSGSFTDIEVQPAGATITGSGTTTLSGVNARVDGFAPLVFEDGTFGGNGAVTVDSTFTDATIEAGLSIGTLNFVNSDSSINGGSIVHEINSTVEMPGVNSDLIDVTGQLDLSNVALELVTVDGAGDPAALPDFNPSGSHKFVIAIANSIGSTTGLTVNTSSFANAFTGVFSTTVSPTGGREALIVRYGEFALADVNQDGSVNLLDVAPFVDAVASGTFQEEADVNCDGAVNLLDVDAFISALAG